MSLLSSFIGHAAGAGAQIIGDQIKADSLLKSQSEYAKMQSELQLERDKTIEAIREASRIATEERAAKGRTEERAAIFNESVERAPTLREINAADAKAKKMVDYDPEVQDLATKAEVGKATATKTAELDFYNRNSADILKQKRQLASASHIDDNASVRKLQGESLQMTIDEKKELSGMLKKYEATKDPQEKAQLRESLVLRGIIKPSSGEYETEKVIEKKTDMASGTETTTERTQKRAKPDGPIKKPITQAEYARLPSGAIFTAPDGTERRKP